MSLLVEIPKVIINVFNTATLRKMTLKESIEYELKLATSQLDFRLEDLKWSNPELYKKVMDVLEIVGEEFKINDNLERDIKKYLVGDWILFMDLKGNMSPHTRLEWHAIRNVIKKHKELGWI